MKPVAAIGGPTVAGLGVRRYLKSRSALANVAADLRHPAMAFMSFSFNARTLPFLRAVMRRSAKPAGGVVVTERLVGESGVGELDLFYVEDVAYSENLSISGVPCTLMRVPGMYHGADGIKPKAAAMQEFRSSMMDHPRSHL